MFVKNHTKLALALTAGFAFAASANAATIVTDFESANPVGSDGYDSGFWDWDGLGFDTTQGWTLYLDSAFSTNTAFQGDTTNLLTIPLAAGGTVDVAELEFRSNELLTNEVSLSPGTTQAMALRSQTYNVGAGDASIDWLQTGATLNAYYSQDDGSTWTAATKGANFSATSGTLQFLIARNEGVDTVNNERTRSRHQRG